MENYNVFSLPYISFPYPVEIPLFFVVPPYGFPRYYINPIEFPPWTSVLEYKVAKLAPSSQVASKRGLATFNSLIFIIFT